MVEAGDLEQLKAQGDLAYRTNGMCNVYGHEAVLLGHTTLSIDEVRLAIP